jgi:hypothetical protein
MPQTTVSRKLSAFEAVGPELVEELKRLGGDDLVEPRADRQHGRHRGPGSTQHVGIGRETENNFSAPLDSRLRVVAYANQVANAEVDMAAKRSKLWFGFLEAGAKGGPVVRDDALSTGNPRTVYLFHFMKGRILEYRRDIVEIKLRDLAAEELPLIPEMRSAYEAARQTFQPRPVPVRRPVRAKPKPFDGEPPELDDEVELDFDADLPPLTDEPADGDTVDHLD